MIAFATVSSLGITHMTLMKCLDWHPMGIFMRKRQRMDIINNKSPTCKTATYYGSCKGLYTSGRDGSRECARESWVPPPLIPIEFLLCTIS